MALRPTNINIAAPNIPKNLVNINKTARESNQLSYPTNLPLPKIGLPTLPEILNNNFKLPTNVELADSIKNIRNNNNNATATDDEDEEEEDTESDSERSTMSSNEDDDYDFFEDYHDNHRYENEDDQFATKYTKKHHHRRYGRNHSNTNERKQKRTHKKKKISPKRKKQTAQNPKKDTKKNKKIIKNEGEFHCKKCRRTFKTNRALASHQRAHKNKVPPSQPQSQSQSQSRLNPSSVPSAPSTNNNEEGSTSSQDNDVYMQQNQQNIPIPPKILETTNTFLTNLPNLNTCNISSIRDLKSLNLTRLAMPVIRGRKRYQINNHNISPHFNDEDYKFHCDKCGATFFYQQDVVKHQQYSECCLRPYLCPFCERPFKSCLSVKKHCVNLHSSIINWDLVGGLLEFVKKHETHHGQGQGQQDGANDNINYAKIVRKFARDFYQIQQQKEKEEKNNPYYIKEY